MSSNVPWEGPLILTALLFPIPGFALGPEAPDNPQAVVITFDLALERATANHPRVLQAESQERSAEAEVGVAQAESWPEISATAAYGYAPMVQTVGSLPVSTVNNYQYLVSADYLLYDFGRRENSIQLAQNTLRTSQINLQSVKQDTASRVADTFFNLLLIKVEMEEAGAQVRRIEDLVKVATDRQTGDLDYELKTLRLGLKRAQILAGEVQRLGNQRLSELRNLLGLPVGDPVEVTGPFPDYREARDVQTLISLAYARNPSMQAALSQEVSQSLTQKIAGSETSPQVSLRGTAAYENGVTTASTSVADMTYLWSWGIEVTMPLFDGLRSANRQAAAAALSEKAHQQTEELRRSLAEAVASAVQNLDASKTQVDLSQDASNEAQSLWDLVKARYHWGSTDGRSCTEASEELFRARVQVLQARHDFTMAGIRLKWLVGEDLGGEVLHK